MSGGSLLSGKTAVVTGGANGMGAGIVRLFKAHGVERGVVLDLPEALGRKTPPGGWTELPVNLRHDASVTSAFEQTREELGSIDVLVAAAGIVPLWTGISGLDPAEWDDVFAVNARGVMRSIQEALPAMDAGGSIVVIASQNAWRGNQNLASYTASKHAVLGLVRSVALDSAPAASVSTRSLPDPSRRMPTFRDWSGASEKVGFRSQMRSIETVKPRPSDGFRRSTRLRAVSCSSRAASRPASPDISCR